ncbi:DASH complex subunit dam1 [Rhizina undulata]
MASLEDTPGKPSVPRKHKSNSRPNSRPATPLRRSSRGSLSGPRSSDDAFPLTALEPAFAELSDAMATLEVNFGDLQIMHDSLSRFNESFASFLYGLNMNAFCMDFPEAPIKESFKMAAEQEASLGPSTGPSYGGRVGGIGGATPWKHDNDVETTFMTNDASFINEPIPTAGRAVSPSPFKTPARRNVAGRGTDTRGGRGRGRGQSGIVRGRGLRYNK